ncbi:MAG: AAA family ATPase, partial [Steroidobacteraceae bacterium]
MNRIVVLNPKGGSGKTTIATNLASYFASRQQRPVLMDFDPQGSSLRWVRKRPPGLPPIHSVNAFEKDPRTTRTFQLRVPDFSTHVIVDTPAAVEAHDLPD